MTEENIDKEKSGKNKKPKLRRVKDEEQLPLTAHLEELRLRLIYSFLSVTICFLVTYAVSDNIIEIIKKPIEGYGLYAISPSEIFFAYLKVSFYSALIISFPFILYQIWEFVAPGLLKKERYYGKLFLVAGTILFATGVLFFYFTVLPYGIDFLLGFSQGMITPQITVSFYLEFVMKLMLAFGIVFEIPIIILFILKTEIVSLETIKNSRPYYVVITFIVAAILTPPDVVSQVSLALPMLILFEGSIMVARIFMKSKAKEEDENQNEQ